MTQEHVVEPRDYLNAQVLDMHRALTSLSEKIEMLDLQNQRIEVCTDPELKLVMASQRDGTRKHIAMPARPEAGQGNEGSAVQGGSHRCAVPLRIVGGTVWRALKGCE